MHARTETPLHDEADAITTRAHGHDNARQVARQHDRLVAGQRGVGRHAFAIRDDERLAVKGTAIAATEDRNRVASLAQQASDSGHHRRLAAAPDAQVADTDHRASQARLVQQPAAVRCTAQPASCAIGSAERRQRPTRDRVPRDHGSKLASAATVWSTAPRFRLTIARARWPIASRRALSPSRPMIAPARSAGDAT